ncbi:sulfotransferase family protein [Nitrospirillum bahiense]|uniref:Sulfotransferase domain-containing protein n=1 Tax=Nitrospirillum amazonense TaxID=28077 RepID=A0A560FAD0_9PROT|nr:sulfotransferase domain-containing protein [Nitrospirillum amazonense]TWB18564.1 sulfotransferase domain-containing protein [Nitrospirillum amazonense]
MTPSAPRRPPRLIGSFGLQGSGSTWVYNVIHAVLETTGVRIARFFANDLTHENILRIRGADVVLVKAHEPSAALLAICLFAGAPVIVTVRDPRDAVVSLMERFGHSFQEAADEVRNSARYLMRLVADCPVWVLRYEDDFMETAATVSKIATHVGVEISDQVADAIFQAHAKGEVVQRIGRFIQEGRMGDDNPRLQFDAASHWHPNHVGDGLVGKYAKKLTADQIMAVEIAGRDFMERFGYVPLTSGLPSGYAIDFGPSGCVNRSVAHGFFRPEISGGAGVMWARTATATVDYPLAGAASWARGTVDLAFAPAFRHGTGEVEVAVEICGRMIAVLRSGSTGEDGVRLSFALERDEVPADGNLELVFRTRNAGSAAALGLSHDDRKLAVGIRRLAVEYGV